MSEALYLILHKVRGAAAFDIATRLCSGPAPCQPSCGHWNGEICQADEENWWIIPTSGHRAYPVWTQALYEIVQNDVMLIMNLPDEVRDHYAINNDDKPVSPSKPHLQLEDIL